MNINNFKEKIAGFNFDEGEDSSFLNMMADSKSGLILGNIKEQNVFSYTRIREENCNVDFGYFHNRGNNKKVKLIQHVQRDE